MTISTHTEPIANSVQATMFLVLPGLVRAKIIDEAKNAVVDSGPRITKSNTFIKPYDKPVSRLRHSISRMQKSQNASPVFVTSIITATVKNSFLKKIK